MSIPSVNDITALLTATNAASQPSSSLAPAPSLASKLSKSGLRFLIEKMEQEKTSLEEKARAKDLAGKEIQKELDIIRPQLKSLIEKVSDCRKRLKTTSAEHETALEEVNVTQNDLNLLLSVAKDDSGPAPMDSSSSSSSSTRFPSKRPHSALNGDDTPELESPAAKKSHNKKAAL